MHFQHDFAKAKLHSTAACPEQAAGSSRAPACATRPTCVLACCAGGWPQESWHQKRFCAQSRPSSMEGSDHPLKGLRPTACGTQGGGARHHRMANSSSHKLQASLYSEVAECAPQGGTSKLVVFYFKKIIDHSNASPSTFLEYGTGRRGMQPLPT